MTPETEPKETQPSAVMLRLTGSCGHEINVLIRDRDEDLEVISAAMDKDEPEALLVRFCPFCMENREFAFPLTDMEPRSEPRSEPMQFSSSSPLSSASFHPLPDWMPDLSVPPTELPFRYWEQGKAAMADKPELAENQLKLAADIFDRQHKTMQVEAVTEDLVELYESQGRHNEAAKLRQKPE